jgi:hypothetical protein
MQPVFAWQSSSMIVVTRLVNNISFRVLIIIVSESLELSDGRNVSGWVFALDGIKFNHSVI